jgi:hypothetical protein
MRGKSEIRMTNDEWAKNAAPSVGGYRATKGYPQTRLAPGGLAPPEPKFIVLPRSYGTFAPATSASARLRRDKRGRGGRLQGFGIASSLLSH